MNGLLSPILPGGPAYARYLSAFPWLGDFGPFASEAAGRVYLCPIDIPWTLRADAIIYQVGAASNGNLRVGIYRQGATPDSPAGGILIAESASTAQGAVNGIQTVAFPETLLVPGLYFLAIQFDGNVASFQEHYDAAASGYFSYYSRGGGYGAFTNPCPAITAHDRGVRSILRISANLGL